MKRRIVTPGARAAADQAKHDHNSLIVTQAQQLNRVTQEWAHLANPRRKMPTLDAQLAYLGHVGLSFDQHVEFIGDEPDEYRHVRLKVSGAISLLLPKKERSIYYNKATADPQVYVLVQLDVPPLTPIFWWVPSQKLKTQKVWTGIR